MEALPRSIRKGTLCCCLRDNSQKFPDRPSRRVPSCFSRLRAWLSEIMSRQRKARRKGSKCRRVILEAITRARKSSDLYLSPATGTVSLAYLRGFCRKGNLTSRSMRTRRWLKRVGGIQTPLFALLCHRHSTTKICYRRRPSR